MFDIGILILYYTYMKTKYDIQFSIEEWLGIAAFFFILGYFILIAQWMWHWKWEIIDYYGDNIATWTLVVILIIRRIKKWLTLKLSRRN